MLTEPDPLAEPSVWATRAQARLDGDPTLADLDDVLEKGAVVGRQRIASEVESGSDTLARTLTHATVAVASAVGAQRAPKSVNTVLSTFRGYALLLWVLVSYLTGGSRFGRSVLSLTVGVGAALVALTLVVPAVPMAVTLTGIVLLLAATSAAALRQGRRRSWRLAARLTAAFLVVAAALVAVVAYQVSSAEPTSRRNF